MPADEVEELRAKNASLEAELKVQKDIVAALLKRIYGVKSEKLDSSQELLDLLWEDGPKKSDAADVQDAGRREGKDAVADQLPHRGRQPGHSATGGQE